MKKATTIIFSKIFFLTPLLILGTWKFDFPFTGEFSWNKIVHYMGTIQREKEYTFSFMFTNSGDEQIIIKEVKSESHLWKAEWTTHPVKPLQSGIVKVTFTPLMAGPVLNYFTVLSNASENEIKLWVEGEVLSPSEIKRN